jgi:uncharacterized protein
MGWFTPAANGIVINVRVVPRASRNEVAGVQGDALRIRLQAPPVEGKANAALVRFLAECLGVRPGNITILSGEKGRTKRVLVSGTAAERVAGLV